MAQNNPEAQTLSLKKSSKFLRQFLILAGLLIGFFTVNPLNAETIAQSSGRRTALLEVYSSEGCSSCPPAEKWVSGLAEDSHLWKDFVPVVFHVDYWDYLGWKDALAQNQFTRRQRAYAAYWKSDSIYTPGFVLNAREWRDWYRKDSLKNLNSPDAGTLTVEQKGKASFIVSYKPDFGTSKATQYRAHAALLFFGIHSDVKAGENAGERLQHDFAAADFKEEDMGLSAEGIYKTEFSLKAPEEFSPEKRGVAVWVSSDRNPEPLQAAGAYLLK